MNERIHVDEPDTSEAVVNALLGMECPQWSALPLEYLSTSGTDNAMWRIRTESGPDLVVRLPRRPRSAAGALDELAVLQQIEGALGPGIRTPRVRHIGEPQEAFPHPWSVLEWLDGEDCWSARNRLDNCTLADDLAHAVVEIGQLPTEGLRARQPGNRGGPLRPLLARLDQWLDDPEWNAADMIDVPNVRRLAAQSLEVADEAVAERFVHGDLIPGNLLVDETRLSAVIDWGGAGRGDPAQDLAPAWAVLTAAQRTPFRAAIGADDATWLRGRAFELEHAVGGVLYYVPRRHALGDIMARTLQRILSDG